MAMSMDPNRAQETIREQASTVPDAITAMEGRILDAIEPGKNVDVARAVIEASSRSVRPQCVYLHTTRNPEASIREAAGHLWARLAAAEATFNLLNQGALLPMDSPAKLPVLSISWSTAAENSGGHKGSWEFEETAVCLPRFVRRRMRA